MTKLKFEHIQVPQRSPEWIQARVGKVTASRLGDFTNHLKNGNSSAVRNAYLRELAYERTFNVAFDHYSTLGMEEGAKNEDFVREQYEQYSGNTVVTCGIFANEDFAASPDGLIGDDGLVEIKWLYANKFSEILSTGTVPREHWMQIQGQLLATARQWCDYVAANGDTGKFVVIRVERDLEFSNVLIQLLEEYRNDPEEYTTFETTLEVVPFTTNNDEATEDQPWA